MNVCFQTFPDVVKNERRNEADCRYAKPPERLRILLVGAGVAGRDDLVDQSVLGSLCGSEETWKLYSDDQHRPYAERLAADLGYTPLHIRYNSGLHTSETGALLSDQLDRLARHWPGGLAELRVLAHSMGGLITRSAVHHAQHLSQDRLGQHTQRHQNGEAYRQRE